MPIEMSCTFSFGISGESMPRFEVHRNDLHVDRLPASIAVSDFPDDAVTGGQVSVPNAHERMTGKSSPQLRVSTRGHDLAGVTFRRRPASTADGLIRRAVSVTGGGLPGRLRADLLTALGSEGRAAYRLMTGREGMFCPTVVIPEVADTPSWSIECTDALANSDAALLEHALDEAFGVDLSPQWTPVLDNPRRWFRSLAEGLRDMGTEFSGDVIVAPQIAPSGGHLVLDNSGNICVAYALFPDDWHSPAHDTPAKKDRLTALLGPARAAMLAALDQPKSMGHLATELNYARSTITHHAQHLIRTGLVASTQTGHHVWLERTVVGHLLVELIDL